MIEITDGRRWAMIDRAAIGLFITPLYLFVDSYPLLAGAFDRAGRIPGRDLWARMAALPIGMVPDRGAGDRRRFLYHEGAIWAGFTGPLLALFAATQPLGFAVPMLVSPLAPP